MPKGRVTAEGLNMRLAPGSDEIVHVLAEHDEVTIIKSETHGKTWLFVWYRKDDFAKYGWVSADFVEIIPPKVSPYFPPVHSPAPVRKRSEPFGVPLSVWLFGALVALAIAALAIAPTLR